MRLRLMRLGIAGLLCLSALLWMLPAAGAQDQTSLANTANSAMQQMANELSAALAASSETVAKSHVRSAIAAGQTAVAALRSLNSIATDDVVRSRSEAALTQTQNAVIKATAALEATGDAFRSGVEAARGEVVEAIAEFAPILPLPGEAPAALPKSGQGDITSANMIGLAAAGVALTLLGATLRRKAAFTMAS